MRKPSRTLKVWFDLRSRKLLGCGGLTPNSMSRCQPFQFFCKVGNKMYNKKKMSWNWWEIFMGFLIGCVVLEEVYLERVKNRGVCIF